MPKPIKPPEQLSFDPASAAGFASGEGNALAAHSNTIEYLKQEDTFLNEQQEAAFKREELKGRKQDRRERKIYAKYTFILISVWLTIIIAIFTLTGCHVLVYSDTVIVTLLTTTTVEVIGLFIIIAKYLFPTKPL